MGNQPRWKETRWSWGENGGGTHTQEILYKCTNEGLLLLYVSSIITCIFPFIYQPLNLCQWTLGWMELKATLGGGGETKKTLSWGCWRAPWSYLAAFLLLLHKSNPLLLLIQMALGCHSSKNLELMSPASQGATDEQMGTAAQGKLPSGRNVRRRWLNRCQESSPDPGAKEEILLPCSAQERRLAWQKCGPQNNLCPTVP